MLKLKSFAKLIVILSMVFGLVGCSKEEVKASISIGMSKSDIFVNETAQLLITLYNENEGDAQKVICNSLNNDVATIILDRAYGLAKGTTEIECLLGKAKSNVITLAVMPVVVAKPEPVPPYVITPAPLVPATPPESTVPFYTLNLVSLTSPINAGMTAVIVVLGKAGVEYSITVNYKSGQSTAAGLGAKIANSKGIISWTWKVGARTSPGIWSIDVYGDDKSIRLDFVVR